MTTFKFRTMKNKEDNKKQPLGEVMPEKEKENKDQYPDHMKSPMHELKDKRQVNDGEEENE